MQGLKWKGREDRREEKREAKMLYFIHLLWIFSLTTTTTINKNSKESILKIERRHNMNNQPESETTITTEGFDVQ
jgi:hypothetical protein